MRRAVERPAVAGFTLLEVIVALAILAVGVGSVFQTFSDGLGNLSRGERYLRAAMIADSQLAQVGRAFELAEISESGDAGDDFSWTLDIRPYELPAAGAASEEDEGRPGLPDPEELGLRLYEIEVSVAWSGGRSITVRSLRLGETPR